MTDGSSRTGAPRDVPPPRPVAPRSAEPPAGGPRLGRAARAVADAVAGLLGGGAFGAGGQAGGAAESSPRGSKSGAAGSTAAGATAGGGRSPGALLGDLLSAAAPRLPVRDRARLRQAYPGATDAEIADALVARAARLTAGIGAGTGGLSAAQWFAPASLLALPLELGAETVLIAGVEVVLIGELHELYGRPAGGDARARASAYVASWSVQRSVDGVGAAALGTLLGSVGVREVRRRLTRRLAGAVPTAAPFLLGAAVGGRGNRRATEKLAERVLADLRGSGGLGPGTGR